MSDYHFEPCTSIPEDNGRQPLFLLVRGQQLLCRMPRYCRRELNGVISVRCCRFSPLSFSIWPDGPVRLLNGISSTAIVVFVAARRWLPQVTGRGAAMLVMRFFTPEYRLA